MAQEDDTQNAGEVTNGLEGYADFLTDIKGRIQTAQVQAALSLSRQVVWLYWQIGHEVLERQTKHRWGAKVVDRLAADLKTAFPGVAGFSRTNLLYMRAFAEAFPDSAIVQQLLDNSPLHLGQYVQLLDKVQDPESVKYSNRPLA